jgi:hypothetical protein
VPIPTGRVRTALAATVAVYGEAELALTRMLARRLAQGLDEPDWAVRRRAELGAVRRAAQLIVDTTSKRGAAAARRTVAQAYRSGRATAVVDLAEALAGDVGPTARGADPRRGNTIQALADAVGRELRPVHEQILPSVMDSYRRAVAAAAGRTLTRAQPQRQAIQSAWAALVDQGIGGFSNRTGRRWQLHTYVEMAVRTAAGRAEVFGLVDQWTADGVRLVYVPDRPRECHLCRPYEARVLSLHGPTGVAAEPNLRTGGTTLVTVTATLADARAAGLFHPGCRHTLKPFLPGRTTLRPAVAPDPEGYAAEQRQRALERHLRHWRMRTAAALDDTERARAGARVDAWTRELVDHVDRHRLTRLRYREQPGAGHTTEDRSDPATL